MMFWRNLRRGIVALSGVIRVGMLLSSLTFSMGIMADVMFKPGTPFVGTSGKTIICQFVDSTTFQPARLTVKPAMTQVSVSINNGKAILGFALVEPQYLGRQQHRRISACLASRDRAER